MLAVVPLTLAAREKNPLHKYAGSYQGETRAVGETRDQSQEGQYSVRHHTIELDLGGDGTATLTQSPAGTDEITSFAHWSVAGDTLSLTFDPSGTMPAPSPMTFRIRHKTLVPVTYDHSLWPKLPPPPLNRR